MRRFYIISFFLLLLLISGVVFGQQDYENDHPLVGEHSWISKYKNVRGTSCCGKNDTFEITRDQAYGLGIGDTLSFRLANQRNVEIKINAIHPTHDGKYWVTTVGCLFTDLQS